MVREGLLTTDLAAALSQERAQAGMATLVQHGIHAAHLTAE